MLPPKINPCEFTSRRDCKINFNIEGSAVTQGTDAGNDSKLRVHSAAARLFAEQNAAQFSER